MCFRSAGTVKTVSGRRVGANFAEIIPDKVQKSSVFGNVYTVDVTGSTNRELFAPPNGDMMNILQNNTQSLTDPQLKTLMRQVAEK